jgi:DNA polymerase III subunit gamma/tau
MQYQVLARKWRPQTFGDLVGQEHVSRTLVNALQGGRVAHAFLFSGPRGSGKTTTARILAKALNCHQGKPGEPCLRCPACTEIAASNCLDVLEIDAASNTGVENIRNVIEEVQYSPARDRNKIYIIDEVHMLSNAAFNALLKTLEEPPPNVVFILATTEYHKIPATILSRCQQYTFKLIRFPLILARLREIARAEKIRISDVALEQVALVSGGSMRDAMSALDQVIAFSGEEVRDDDVVMLLGLVEPAVLARMARAIAANDVDTVLQVVSDLVESGQDLQNFCRRLLAHIRNLMILRAGVSDPGVLGVPESLIQDLKQQAELFSREDLLRLFDACVKIELELKYSNQPRFQLEMGLVELAHIARLRPLEEVIEDFRRQIASGFAQSGPTPAAAPPRLSATPHSRGESATPAAAPRPAAVSTAPPSTGADLLGRIASRIQRPALASLLDGLAGAVLSGDVVSLETGGASEFIRRQIQDNLPVLSRAASEALGRPVRVQIAGSPSPVPPASEAPSPAPKRELTVEELAKREPAIQSFIDVFPGPVKVEEIDS